MLCSSILGFRRPGFSSRIQTCFLWIPQRFSYSRDRTGFAVSTEKGFRNPAMFPAEPLTVRDCARPKFRKYSGNKGAALWLFLCVVANDAGACFASVHDDDVALS
ncbi:hypothetical protein QR685DRAFT_511864 [Neurospora intermedia]|uniref:Uncharacterized protein n=1 Tax=Neurospora intermedia TaxID=5142 RepID=A0ABR3DR46_NEUIN